MKPKKKPVIPALPKDTVKVYLENSVENPDRAQARTFAQPEVQAAATIQRWQGNTVDVNQIIDELGRQTDELKTGRMHRAEAMLLSQAHTLDELFNTLARKAYGQEYLKNYETFLRLALKAQGQCRSTLETLSNIKNPPVVFAKQANFASGPQQINNGVPTTHAEEIKKNSNELLLEAKNGETLDSRATGAAIGSNSEMATMEKIDRP